MRALSSHILLFAISLGAVGRAQAADLPADMPAVEADSSLDTFDLAWLATTDDGIGGFHRPERGERPRPAARPAGGAGELAVEASVALVSDFRSGGISSSGGKPAVQAEIAIEHRSGLFGGVWASSLDPADGPDAEIEVSAGYGWKWGDAEPSLGAVLYLYPGLTQSSYVELQTEVAVPVGAGRVAANAAYTPRQGHVPTDNLYLGLYSEFPLGHPGGVTMIATVGRENGAFGHRKLDWSLGLRRRRGAVEFGADYVDAASTRGERHAGATMVLSVRYII